MNISGDDVVKMLVGLVVALAGLVGWRKSNQIKNQNASDNRQSTFEENLQKRLDIALARIEELLKERDELKADVMEARARMTVAQMLSDGDEAGAIAFAQQSGFTDFDRPLRGRPPAPRPSSSHDVFQANVQYTPPPRKK